MAQISDKELIKKAKEVAIIHKSPDYVTIGEVGCALITDKNNIYVGVSIDAPCGIGFCAEHSAIATMVTNREYKIKKIVAVASNGTVIPPCGRCREMIYEIDKENYDTEVIINEKQTKKLKEL